MFISFCLCWVFAAAGGLSLVVASGGCSLATVHELLVAVASLGSADSRPSGFSRCSSRAPEGGLAAVARGPSGPMARGIVQDQGPNP